MGETEYTFGRNDTPEKVAKKHGHKDFQAIWDADAMVALRRKRKRKEADKLEAGDALVIPPPPAALAAARKGYSDGRKSMEESLGKMTKALGSLEIPQRDIDSSHGKVLSDPQDGKRELETTLVVADIAAFVDTQTVTLAGTAVKASRAAEMSSKGLADFARLSIVEVGALGGEEVLSPVVQNLYQTNDFLLSGNELHKATTNLASPSFWAKTVNFGSQQKSIGEFVKDLPKVRNEKPNADINKAVKVAEWLRYAHLKKVDDKIGALNKRFKGAAEGIKACDTVLAWLK